MVPEMKIFETAKLRKATALIAADRYKTAKTIPTVFHFEPCLFETAGRRMQTVEIKHASIDGKDIYLLDNFFSAQETSAMQTFSQQAAFSRDIFGSAESIGKGQRPARSMNSQEKWEFFSHPPEAVEAIYQWFCWLSVRLDAEISTFPWDLCHQDISSPAIATNRVDAQSAECMEMGKHRDVDPERGLAFGLSALYGQGHHLEPFANGAPGKPWLVSVMLYTTDENFSPAYGMGTVFCNEQKETVFRAECRSMRLVLFAGDIIHSIEESRLPLGSSSGRVSYVFKLAINPRRTDQCVKELFSQLVSSFSS